MNIEKINPNIKYVYHYTLKKNVKKILNDKAIKSKDQYVFFTKSLNDSIIAFEREMMQENKLYIDVEGNLRKREKCNKDDYCILKIPYVNDSQFFKFNFENQSKESIYTISISHKGNYKFKEAKVLEFPKNRKLNVFSKTAVAAIVAGIMLFPYNAYAASWLDTNNYDISWYENEEGTKYEINTAEQMAGLAHLVNNENETFAGKEIWINEDIDLTANTWETIKDIFKGTIDGSHRIILNYLDGKLIGNKDISLVEYSYKILEDKNNLKNVAIGNPYTVEKLKLSTGARAVFLNNKELSNDQSLLNLTENDIIEVFIGNYNIFIKDSKGIILPFYFESGDSIENLKTKYSEKVNIPKNKIILKYNEKELEDKKTFADYNIKPKQYITLDAYVKFDINTSVEEGKGNITSSKNTALSGEKITITLNPDLEYELSKLIVNGIEKTNEVQNNELNIECGDEDINVKVSYKLKEKPKDNVDKVEEQPKDNIEIKDKTEENVLTSNPPTGDNIIVYIIALITSIVGMIICECKKIMKK